MRLLFCGYKLLNSGRFIWFNLIEVIEIGNFLVLGVKREGVFGMIFRFLVKYI